MNPGKLNKRLHFNRFSIWAQRIVKPKKRQNGQNQEEYEFIIRSREIDEYSTFACNDIQYIVLTIDYHSPGYLKLTCEKSKIHTFYDTCTVSRMVETKGPNGSDRAELKVIYKNIPCELVRLASGSATESEQENAVRQNYDLWTTNNIDLLVGDSIEVTHKVDVFNVTVIDAFKSHTHQILSIKLEGEA